MVNWIELEMSLRNQLERLLKLTTLTMEDWVIYISVISWSLQHFMCSEEIKRS